MILSTPLNGAANDFGLHRPYRNLRSVDWRHVEIDPSGVEFNLTFSDWLRLFREVGFAVDDYHELYAPEDRDGKSFTVPADWAKSYPSEQVWCLRKL
jgi:hypothetical protein